MDAGQFEAPPLESFPSRGGVFILFPESVRNKQDLRHIPGAEKLADGVGRVLQIPENIVRMTAENSEIFDTNPVGWRVELERSKRFLISDLLSQSDLVLSLKYKQQFQSRE